MRHEEAWHRAVEDDHLHVRIGFELVEHLRKLAHFGGTHDVQRRVVERDDPVSRALPRDADLCPAGSKPALGCGQRDLRRCGRRVGWMSSSAGLPFARFTESEEMDRVQRFLH